MPVIKSRDSWSLETQEARNRKGPLIKVKLRSGQFVKMYESDAAAQGLIKKKSDPQGKKIKKPEGNKIKKPEQDKAAPAAPEQIQDDFTIIPGVGPATDRKLHSQGINTFEQLKNSDLDLPEKVIEAIEEWFIQEA